MPYVEKAHGGAILRCKLCDELVTSYFPEVVQELPEHIKRQLKMHMRVKHGIGGTDGADADRRDDRIAV